MAMNDTTTRQWGVRRTPLHMVRGVVDAKDGGVTEPDLWRAVRAYGEDYPTGTEGWDLSMIAQVQAGWSGWTWKHDTPDGDCIYTVNAAQRLVSTDLYPLGERNGGRSLAYAAVWTLGVLLHLPSRDSESLTVMDAFILDHTAVLVFACLGLKAGVTMSVYLDSKAGVDHVVRELSEREVQAAGEGIVAIANGVLDLLRQAGIH